MAFNFRKPQEDKLERTHALRGAILVQCRLLHPGSAFRRHLLVLGEEAGLSENEFDLALGWLEQRGWVLVSDPRKVLGVVDREVKLTARGIDAALMIDDKQPTTAHLPAEA